VNDTIVIALLLAGAIFGGKFPDLGSLGSLIPSVGPKVEVAEPSADLQAKLLDVRTALGSAKPEQKAHLAGLFRDLASAVERDTDVITTSGIYREGYRRAAQVANQKMQSPVPGLDNAVSSFVSGQIGLENSSLDSDKRAKLVAALNGIQWACSK
jgi:hypothetical protein